MDAHRRRISQLLSHDQTSLAHNVRDVVRRARKIPNFSKPGVYPLISSDFASFEALEAEFDFAFGDSFFDVLRAVTQHSIDQPGEMVSHGNNSFGSAQATFEAAILCPVQSCCCVVPRAKFTIVSTNSASTAAMHRQLSTLPPLIELFGQSPRASCRAGFWPRFAVRL